MVNEVITADLQINLNNRPKDTIKVLKYIKDFAIEKKCSRVVVCGDIYEYRTPKPEEQKIFQQWVMSLVKENVKVLIVIGNHDTVSSKLSDKNYYTFGEFTNLGLSKVKVVESGYKENGVYYGHFLLKGAKLGPHNYLYEEGVTAQELVDANPECDFFFLGDVHKNQTVEASKPVIYVGSPERENFGERNEKKGFIWFHDNTPDFICSPARTMIQIEEVWEDGKRPNKPEFSVENAIIKVIINIEKEYLKKVDLNKVRQRYKEAYEIASIEFDIIEKKKVRNEQINESKTPKDCFLEYSKHFDFDEETIRQGLTILEEVV